jgi:hypothetical protein
MQVLDHLVGGKHPRVCDLVGVGEHGHVLSE